MNLDGRGIVRFFVVLALTAFPLHAVAHAFGQRYDLPLPLSLYLSAGGAAVALSFIVVIFLRISQSRIQRSVELTQIRVFHLMMSHASRHLFQVISLILFTMIIVTGLFAEQDPRVNFAPVFVWIVWWVGLAYVAAFIGNVWDALNPWSTCFDLLCWLRPSWSQPVLAVSPKVGSWPALFFLALFAYLEFISGVAHEPDTLATLILVYSLITLSGMRVFGKLRWLEQGEIFHLLFGFWSRFAPIQGKQQSLQLRWPGSGLLSDKPVSTSHMMIVLFMLCSVTFDGFIETPLWLEINRSLTVWASNSAITSDVLSPHSIQTALLTAALLSTFAGFVMVYLLFIALTNALSARHDSIMLCARRYVLSLIPIAIAYHLAHYLSYLLISGQLIIPIISDPFTLDWNLFGTLKYRIDIGIIDAGDVWYLSIFAIVIGHIFAVAIAHITALKHEQSHTVAVISQLPLLALMISYTMLSLWILAQPIVS